MEFNELKTKMEGMGFKFEWIDEDVEGTEEDEDTGKEREAKFHSTGWWMFHPPDYKFPRIFIPFNDSHPSIGYLNVAIEGYEKRHDRDEEEAKMMKDFEERFNQRYRTPPHSLNE